MIPGFSVDILTVSAVIFGGGIIAVTLYTYLLDYVDGFKRH
jgi:hypothetical protein